MRVLVTGSAGLIGSRRSRSSTASASTCTASTTTCGRASSGRPATPPGTASGSKATSTSYTHHDLDIRDREGVDALVAKQRPELVVRAAAQPSHDLAATRPFDDFDVNAGGTLNLLEAFRRHALTGCSSRSRPTRSTATTPTGSRSSRLDTRFDYADPADAEGIDETMSIEGCLHSLFGASKVAADVLTQEYGRYFDLNTATFRGGCLTGPRTPASSSTASSATSCAPPSRRVRTRCSATRGSRCGTRSTRPT